MKIIATAAAAFLLACAFGAPASAAPMVPASAAIAGDVAAPQIEQAAYRGHRNWRGNRGRHYGWTRGHHYGARNHGRRGRH
ncbi:MAG: hypothetical protein JWL62_657 [Hyphomicrobiales bacterium]|nr:hypothetical protein [Hyphomicrobiales bacterium]